MKPVVDRLKVAYSGKVAFKLMNVDADQTANKLANAYGVQYVPTFVFINADGTRSGQPVVGGMDETRFRSLLDSLK
jgi:thioredoxin-like negative regulator of GroEL